jgi:hypothetical protein
LHLEARSLKGVPFRRHDHLPVASPKCMIDNRLWLSDISMFLCFLHTRDCDWSFDSDERTLRYAHDHLPWSSYPSCCFYYRIAVSGTAHTLAKDWSFDSDERTLRYAHE